MRLQEDPDVVDDTAADDEEVAELTPLHFASKDGHVEVASYLLDNWADIDATGG